MAALRRPSRQATRPYRLVSGELIALQIRSTGIARWKRVQCVRLFSFFGAPKQPPRRTYPDYNAQDSGEREVKAARVEEGLKGFAHALALHSTGGQ